MKQVFIYSLKVWLTTIAIAYVALLSMVFYGLSKSDHSKELDPYFATFAFFIINLMFLPAWFVFTWCVKPITKRVVIGWKQKALLCVVASILIGCTVTPLVVTTYPDVTYYEIGLWYLACMMISIWIYNPAALSKIAGNFHDTNNENEASSNL